MRKCSLVGNYTNKSISKIDFNFYGMSVVLIVQVYLQL